MVIGEILFAIFMMVLFFNVLINEIGLFCFIIVLVIFIFLIYLRIMVNNSCKNCKKMFTLKKLRSSIIKEEDIRIKTEIETRDKYGELISVSSQYVPGKKITYETEYICKNCGHKTVSTHSEKKRTV